MARRPLRLRDPKLIWRHIAYGLLAGLVGGLLLGAGGRVAMRLIAVAAGSEVGASLGGSLEVVATGVLFGTPGGLGYLVVRKLVPGSGLWTGALFGALYFGFLALVPPPAARSAVAALGQLPAALSLFGLLFVGYGLLVEATLRRLLKE